MGRMIQEDTMDPHEPTTEEVDGTEGAPVDRSPARPLWLWVVIGLVVIAAGVAAIVLLSPEEETGSTGTAELNTAPVVRTDLADETEYDGTLGRPDAEPIAAGSAGTITATAEPGDELASGDELFRVDDEPVVLLEGATPAFRDLAYGDTELTLPAGRQGTITYVPSEGSPVLEGETIARIDEVPVIALEGDLPMYRTLSEGDEGVDVEQLEAALVRLGYDPDGNVTVDEDFTSQTEAMVERWQQDLGVDETGQVSPADLVFAPLPAQVVTVQADTGVVVSPTSPVMTVRGGDPISGDDVLQLEEALVGLGFLNSSDDVLDVGDIEAITSFQDSVDMEVDGVLSLGEIVFRSGGVRIASVISSVGTATQPSTPVIEAASLETIVRMALPAEDQGDFSVGDAVVIELPDRTETPGTVTDVATVATTDQQGSAFFEVEIALDDPSAAGNLDEAPVDVRIVTDTVEDVLAVPVTALLALSEGGYAVEVVDGDSTRLVGVEPGFFADGMVEVSGNLDTSDEVVVP